MDSIRILNEYEAFELLKNDGYVYRDITTNQIEELFEIENPSRIFSSTFIQERNRYKSNNIHLNECVYVLFPWKRTIIKSVSQKAFYKLLTDRSRGLISEKKQELLSKLSIGIAGLSTGYGIATILIQIGVSRLCLAEFDVLETTNLNRMQASIADVGLPKIESLARRLYEINPFIELRLFEQGITKENMNLFTGSRSEKLNVIFDEMDDFVMKVYLREKARVSGIPVISVIALDEVVYIESRRFDKNNNLKLFANGNTEFEKRVILGEKLTQTELDNYEIALIGNNNISSRLMKVVKNIGVTYASGPQLTTATHKASVDAVQKLLQVI